jgi:hypothetical protein
MESSSAGYVDVPLGNEPEHQQHQPPPATTGPVMRKQPSRLASGMKRLASRVTSIRVPDSVMGLKRSHSSAQPALRGLRFLDKASAGKDGWKSVEKRFDDMSGEDGRLHQENFAKCIGTYELRSNDCRLVASCFRDLDAPTPTVIAFSRALMVG